jgi:hypothetical protein
MQLLMWLRALAVWLVLIGAEVVHGVLRTALLVPSVGDFRSRQIGVLSGSALILTIAYLSIGWIQPVRSATALLAVGLGWAALTLLFEISLGRLVLGYPWDRIASDYDMARGGLLPLGLAAMASAPLLAATLRKRRLACASYRRTPRP